MGEQVFHIIAFSSDHFERCIDQSAFRTGTIHPCDTANNIMSISHFHIIISYSFILIWIKYELLNEVHFFQFYVSLYSQQEHKTVVGLLWHRICHPNWRHLGHTGNICKAKMMQYAQSLIQWFYFNRKQKSAVKNVVTSSACLELNCRQIPTWASNVPSSRKRFDV